MSRILGFVFACISLCPTLVSQENKVDSAQSSNSTSKEFKADFRSQLRLGFDSNAFRLNKGQQDSLDTNDAQDRASGRYDDMEEVEDFSIQLRGDVAFEFDGWADRELLVRPGLRVDIYTINPRKTFAEFLLELEQDLGKGKTLALDFSYELEQFRKNYLKDATDLTGNVNRGERVYQAGNFDQLLLELSYGERLYRLKKDQKPSFGIQELTGLVSLGYENRTYENFSNRDRNSLRFGLGLEFDLIKRLELELRYLFKYVDAGGGREILILDETDFGVDFNNDTDANDQNRRTSQTVDRSHFYNQLGLELSYGFIDDWEAWFGYELSFQNYISDERFDLSYNDREDIQQRLELGLGWEFEKNWEAALRFIYIKDEVERDGVQSDPDNEDSYERFLVLISVATEF